MHLDIPMVIHPHHLLLIHLVIQALEFHQELHVEFPSLILFTLKKNDFPIKRCSSAKNLPNQVINCARFFSYSTKRLSICVTNSGCSLDFEEKTNDRMKFSSLFTYIESINSIPCFFDFLSFFLQNFDIIR